MSGLTIPVSPGRVTQLTGAALSKGASIYNTDSINGIWVGTSRSVAPGAGQYIGPLGSGQWLNDSQAFACVDSGVTGTVQVVVSTDISNLNNPLAIAEATAAEIATSGLAAAIGVQVANQLLLNGVPNVLLQDQIVSLSGGFFTAGTHLDVNNIGKYASLIVQVVGTTANPAIMQVDYHEESPLNPAFFTIPEYYVNPLNSYVVTWEVPVNAQSMRLSNIGLDAISVVVYGTNRLVPGPRMLGMTNTSRLFQYTGNLAAGTFTSMPQTDGTPAAISTFNGQTYWSALGTPGVSIYAQTIRPNGTPVQTLVTTLTGALVSGTFFHPMQPVQWLARASSALTGVNAPWGLVQG